MAGRNPGAMSVSNPNDHSTSYPGMLWFFGTTFWTSRPQNRVISTVIFMKCSCLPGNLHRPSSPLSWSNLAFVKPALLKLGLLRLSGFGCEQTHDVQVQAGAFISISGRRKQEFGKPSNQRSKTTKIIQNPSPLSKWSLHCPYLSHSTLFDSALSSPESNVEALSSVFCFNATSQLSDLFRHDPRRP